MFRKFVFASFLACGLVSAHAQTDPSTAVVVATAPATAPVPTAAPAVSIVPGDYRGDVRANNGDYAFVIKIEKVEGDKIFGSSHFYKADVQCRRPFPMVGTVTPEGTVFLDASQNLEVAGCGRTFDLKLTSTGFEGRLKGTRGEFTVTLTRL
jgi:hypothetical protein